MKPLLLLFLFSASGLIAQTPESEITDSNGRKVLWGSFTKDDLKQEPYKDWFEKGFNDYSPNPQIANSLKSALNEYSIAVYLGTWCGDSKREVPRLLKLLEAANYDPSKLNIIGLRSDGNYYKQGPNKETDGKNIHRVPTIIVSKNGQEVNRIVEDPIVSLEADLLAITKGEYTAQYPLANSLGQRFELDPNKGLSRTKLKKWAKKWADKEFSAYELNTLARVLFAKNRDQQGFAAMELNLLLFPEDARLHFALGKRLETAGKTKDAKNAYTTAARLDPEKEEYITALNRLKTESSGE